MAISSSIRYVLSQDTPVSDPLRVHEITLSIERQNRIVSDLTQSRRFNPAKSTLTFYSLTMSKCEKIWAWFLLIFLRPLSYVFPTLLEAIEEFKSFSWIAYQVKPLPLKKTTIASAVQKNPEEALILAMSPTERNAALLEAARGKNKARIEILLREKADIHSKDEKGKTALHLAAERGYYDIAALLVAQGALTNAQDVNHNTPLHLAVSIGHYPLALLLIQNKADPLAQNNCGRTPLHYAAWMTTIDRVSNEATRNLGIEAFTKIIYLLARPDTVNIADLQGKTPLHLATYFNRQDAIKALLDCEASSEIQDGDKKSALDYAFEKRYTAILLLLLKYQPSLATAQKIATKLLYKTLTETDAPLDLVKTLIEGGALILPQNKEEKSLIEIAAFYNSFVNKYEVLAFLLNELNKIGDDGKTRRKYATALLFKAIQAKRSIQLVATLVNSGALILAENKEKTTPIELAAQLRTLDILVYLFSELRKLPGGEAKAKKMATDLLFKAINYANPLELITTLIECKASILDKNSCDQTPLDLVIIDDHKIKILHIFISALEKTLSKEEAQKIKNEMLIKATRFLQYKTIELLLLNGAEVDFVDETGQNAIALAMKYGKADLLKYFLTKKAEKIRDPSAFKVYISALLLEAMQRNDAAPSLIESLLEYKPDVHVVDDKGWTPLHHAAHHANTAMIGILLRQGAEKTRKNKEGKTPYECFKPTAARDKLIYADSFLKP